MEIESRIAREVYEKEMRLREEKKKLKSHYKTKRKTSQEMARLHEKQLKKQIKNAKPTINIKELRERPGRLGMKASTTIGNSMVALYPKL